MTDQEWGPWIEHDGSPCPCVGEFIEMKGTCSCPNTLFGIAQNTPDWQRAMWFECAICGDQGFLSIERYRVHKPRAIAQLKGLLKPQPPETPAEQTRTRSSTAPETPEGAPAHPQTPTSDRLSTTLQRKWTSPWPLARIDYGKL